MGGYDIYIKATNHIFKETMTTDVDGKSRFRRICEQNRVKTVILPKGTAFRPAKDDDDLPSLVLPRVCRQLYTETALLPYMLNHFKLVGHLHAAPGAKYDNSWYNSLDYWMTRRTPAQLKVITSLAPSFRYIFQYRNGNRPSFCTTFPSLQDLDLRAGSSALGTDGPQRVWKTRKVIAKDLESSLTIQWPAEQDWGWNPDRDLELALEEGPTHFNSIQGLSME